MPGLGKAGEDLVAREYEKLGFSVIARNFIFPKGKQVGELDLVCLGQGEIVFVEVKVRNTPSFGSGFDAVGSSKRKKLVKTAKLFMQQKPDYSGLNYRIDVAWVTIDKGRHSVKILTNAIEDLD